jgi:hypothetical protein
VSRCLCINRLVPRLERVQLRVLVDETHDVVKAVELLRVHVQAVRHLSVPSDQLEQLEFVVEAFAGAVATAGEAKTATEGCKRNRTGGENPASAMTRAAVAAMRTKMKTANAARRNR